MLMLNKERKNKNDIVKGGLLKKKKMKKFPIEITFTFKVKLIEICGSGRNGGGKAFKMKLK